MSLEELYVMRHGETDWNASLRMQGHQDIPLNAAGLAQARAVAPSVATLRPEVVVSSDLQRTLVTAHVIADLIGQPVISDARLRETLLGEWEGLDRDEVEARYPGEWERWRHRGARMAPPGGESRVEVAERALTVVDELDAAGHRSALLVTHGGLIVGLTGRLLGLPEDHWGTLIGVGNCHGAIFHRMGGRWRLRTYNGVLGAIA